MRIGAREIAPGRACYILAEAGVNHNGSLDRALALADAAACVGADAVKFQTFTAERLVLPGAAKARYQRQASDASEDQFAMLKKLELSPRDHEALAAHCRDVGITFLSTPFDESSADLLEALGVEAFKIGSGDVTNLPLLAHVAGKGRPVILSTGMSTMQEVERAVAAIRSAGDPPLALLHCVSNYPADPRDVNLRAMATLAGAFGVPVGYSDHTMGAAIPIAAAALGACVIEKHLTLDRGLPGPDQQASMEPGEFQHMVDAIRRVESALGDGAKRPAASEADVQSVARRSLVAAVAIPEGAVITPDMLAARRPGTGLAPGRRGELVGKTACRDIPEGTMIEMRMVR